MQKPFSDGKPLFEAKKKLKFLFKAMKKLLFEQNLFVIPGYGVEEKCKGKHCATNMLLSGEYPLRSEI